MTDEQRATLDSSSLEWSHREAGSKIQIIGWSLYVAILWLIKFSLAVFYSRLTYVLIAEAVADKLTRLQDWPPTPPDPRSCGIRHPGCYMACNTTVPPFVLSAFPRLLANHPEPRKYVRHALIIPALTNRARLLPTNNLPCLCFAYCYSQHPH